MATCGWWTGLSLPGGRCVLAGRPDSGAERLPGHGGAGRTGHAPGLAAVPEPPRAADVAFDWRRLDRWVQDTYFDAVAEFFRRNGVQLALGLLAFIFLFKLGEAFLGRMVIRFYIEVGFSNADIGTYSKGLGWVVTMVCAVAAGLLTARLGVVRGLFLAGIAMAATNLLFAWIAIVGPDTRALAFAVVADGVTSAFSTVAFVAFISYYTSRLHTAAQYGALASLGNSGAKPGRREQRRRDRRAGRGLGIVLRHHRADGDAVARRAGVDRAAGVPREHASSGTNILSTSKETKTWLQPNPKRTSP